MYNIVSGSVKTNTIRSNLTERKYWKKNDAKCRCAECHIFFVWGFIVYNCVHSIILDGSFFYFFPP